MARLNWGAAFAVAVGLHAAIAFGFLYQPPMPPLARHGFGDGGVVLGLAANDGPAATGMAAAAANSPATEPVAAEPADPPTAVPTPTPLPAPTVTEKTAPPEASPPPPVPTPTPAPVAKSVPVPEPAPAVRDPAPEMPAAVVTAATPRPEPDPVPAPNQAPEAMPPATPTPAATTTTATGPENAESQASAPRRQSASIDAAGSADGTASARGASGSGRTGRGDPRAARDYFRELMAWLARHKAYPVAAKKAKHQGVVTLEFAIERSGSVLFARVKTGSGYAALDQAALDMVARANPVPAIPDALARDRLSLAIPIEFSLITK